MGDNRGESRAKVLHRLCRSLAPMVQQSGAERSAALHHARGRQPMGLFLLPGAPERACHVCQRSFLAYRFHLSAAVEGVFAAVGFHVVE